MEGRAFGYTLVELMAGILYEVVEGKARVRSNW